MFSLTRIESMKFAAAGALMTLAVASAPACADDLARNEGPVGPHQPILTTVGNKRVIAFYVPNSGHCAVSAVVWDRSDTEAGSAARVRVSLSPQQMVHIDSPENESLNLQCGEYADTLSIVTASERIAFGVKE